MEEKDLITITGRFTLFYTCKHSVRYRPVDEVSSQLASAIYLKNESYNNLGNPKNIVVEVKAQNENVS